MKNFLFSFVVLISVTALGQTFQTTTLAGGGTVGNVDATGTSARFGALAGSTIDNDGNIYVCDFLNNKIRKITPAGVVTSFAGNGGPGGFADGTGTGALFNGPHDICFDKTNSVFYVADRENHKIRKITMAGVVTTIAGSTSGFVNGIGTAGAKFDSPSGIDVDLAGNLVVADRLNHVIRKINVATGVVSTLSGDGIQGYVNGNAVTARFNNPTDVIIDKNGFCYITDYGNNVIRDIDYNGFAGTFSGTGTPGNNDGTSYTTAQYNGPYALAFLNNSIIVLDRISHRLRRIDRVRTIVETILGSTMGFTNGTGTASQFNSPSGIAVSGNALYVSDWYNYVLRKVEIQDSCTNATVLTANSGTVSMGTINGNIPIGGSCYGSYATENPNANANWWSFTPTQNGLLNITSATPENAVTVNTRLSISYGACGDLNCFSSNDNVSAGDLRSTLNELILTAGTTYYFVWDDIGTDTGAVNFTYAFTPQTCFRPVSAHIYNDATENSIHVGWSAPTLGDTSPDSYTLELGVSGFTPGTGTALQTVVTTDTNYLFSGLNPSTLYVVYVKSTCATSDISSWIGISTYTQFSAQNINYAENFDGSSNYLNSGWNRPAGMTNSSTWGTNTSSSLSQSGSNSIVSRSEFNTPANSYIYSRKLNLSVGQNYRVSYYVRKNANYINGIYKVFVTPNANYTNVANHTLLHDSGNFTNLTYVYREHNFVVGSTGEYRISFKNESSKNIYYQLAGGVYLDTFSVSTVLSVEDFNKSGLSMFPNPVLDHVSIANNVNIQINTYSVVDLNGRILMNKKYDANDNTIDLTSLTKGIYFIQLETEKGTLSKKIIKE